MKGKKGYFNKKNNDLFHSKRVLMEKTFKKLDQMTNNKIKLPKSSIPTKLKAIHLYFEYMNSKGVKLDKEAIKFININFEKKQPKNQN
jgi:hypothetical protein